MRGSCQKFSGSEAEQHVGSCGASASPLSRMLRCSEAQGIGLSQYLGKGLQEILLSLSDVQKHAYKSAIDKIPPKSCLPPRHQCSLRQQEVLWVYRIVIGGEKP